jgi:hypothetical protein
MTARCVKIEYTGNRVLNDRIVYPRSLLSKALYTSLYAHQWYEIEHSSNKRDNGTTTGIYNERETMKLLANNRFLAA